MKAIQQNITLDEMITNRLKELDELVKEQTLIKGTLNDELNNICLGFEEIELDNIETFENDEYGFEMEIYPTINEYVIRDFVIYGDTNFSEEKELTISYSVDYEELETREDYTSFDYKMDYEDFEDILETYKLKYVIELKKQFRNNDLMFRALMDETKTLQSASFSLGKIELILKGVK